MRCFLLLLGTCLSLLLPDHTWGQCPGMTIQQTPFAHEQLTISDTAKPFTPAVYKPTGITPTMAVVSVQGGAIHYLLTGTPTPTLGHEITGTPTTSFQICGLDSITLFKAIRLAATDATLTITYYKTKAP